MLTGFILTDTFRLGQLLKVQSGKIKLLLKNYITACSKFIQWQVIDVCDLNIENPADWHSYLPVLEDFRCGVGLDQIGAYNIPLFIIGGEEIIPMPKVDFSNVVRDEYVLPVDMLYCFGRDAEQNPERLFKDDPYFAVGRLPITFGITIDNLSDYLDNCVSLLSAGIPSRGAVVTTAESWYEASEEMMRDIPAVTLSSARVPLNGNMISCPLLDTTNQSMYDNYVHELQKADVWVFNLHGSQQEGVSFFVGDSITSSAFPVAMQTSMLNNAHPVIFNTIACFGARYTGYQVSDSMLLSSFVKGTMLYCGAGHSAMYNPIQPGRAAMLMKYYMIYLHKGFPAGMALLKAKQDYYCDYHALDEDVTALITILEFNLFGCPILSMLPKMEFSYQPEAPHQAAKKSLATYRPKKATPLFNKQMKMLDLGMQVKYSLDKQLSSAQQKVEMEAKRYFHTENAKLEQVYRLSQNDSDTGYRFVYRCSPKSSAVEMFYMIECDNQGNILHVTGSI